MEHIQRVGDDDPTYTVPYVPEDRKRHRWEDLFMDIPLKMERGLDGLYAAAAGPLLLPHTAARIADQFVRAHGGQLQARNEAQDVVFEARLPRRA